MVRDTLSDMDTVLNYSDSPMYFMSHKPSVKMPGLQAPTQASIPYRIPNFNFESISKRTSHQEWRKVHGTPLTRPWFDSFFNDMGFLSTVYGKYIHPDDSCKAEEVQKILRKGYEFISGPDTYKPLILEQTPYYSASAFALIGSGAAPYNPIKRSFILNDTAEIHFPSFKITRRIRVETDVSKLSKGINRAPVYEGIPHLHTNPLASLIMPIDDIRAVHSDQSIKPMTDYSPHRINASLDHQNERKKQYLKSLIMRAIDP